MPENINDFYNRLKASNLKVGADVETFKRKLAEGSNAQDFLAFVRSKSIETPTLGELQSWIGVKKKEGGTVPQKQAEAFRFDLSSRPETTTEKTDRHEVIKNLGAQEFLNRYNQSQTFDWTQGSGDIGRALGSKFEFLQTREGKVGKILNDYTTQGKSDINDLTYVRDVAPTAAYEVMKQYVPTIQSPSTITDQDVSLFQKNSQAAIQKEVMQNYLNFGKQVSNDAFGTLASFDYVDQTKLGMPNYMDYLSKQFNANRQKEMDSLEREIPKTMPGQGVGGAAMAPLPNIRSDKDYQEYSRRASLINEKYDKAIDAAAKFSALSVIKAKPSATAFEVGMEYLKVADPSKYSNRKKLGAEVTDDDRMIAELGSQVKMASQDPNYIKTALDERGTLDVKYPSALVADTYHRISAELYKSERNWFFNPAESAADVDNIIDQLPQKNRDAYYQYIRPKLKATGDGFESILGGLGMAALPSRAGRILATPISDIATSKIPQSGAINWFTKGFVNTAIETGKGIGNITGLRTEKDIARDVLNRPYNTADQQVGESPFALAKFNSYKDRLAKGDKLTVDELNEYTDLKSYNNVRTGFDKWIDNSFNVLGQVAFQALASKGIGAGLTKGASAVSSYGANLRATAALGAEDLAVSSSLGKLSEQSLQTIQKVAAAGVGYMSSLNGAAEQAMELMPDNPTKRAIFAHAVAFFNAASENVFQDQKVIDALGKEVAPNIAKVIEKIGTEGMTRELFESSIKKAVLSGANLVKYAGVEASKEAIEESLTSIGTSLTTALLSPSQFQFSEAAKDAVDTFTTMLVDGALVGTMAGVKEFRANNIGIPYLAQLGVNPQFTNDVKSVMLKMKTDGQLSEQDYNDKLSLINNIGKAHQALATVPDEFKNISRRAYEKYSVAFAYENYLEDKVKQSNDDAVKEQLNKKIDESKKLRKAILNRDLFIDENYAAVTPEQASADLAAKAGVVEMPTEEQIADDLINGKVSSFTYPSMAEIPKDIQELVDNNKIKVTPVKDANGVEVFKIDMAESLANYITSKQKQDATKESQGQIKEGGAESNITEPARTQDGQPKEGQGEGGAGQGAVTTANVGDSNISSETVAPEVKKGEVVTTKPVVSTVTEMTDQETEQEIERDRLSQEVYRTKNEIARSENTEEAISKYNEAKKALEDFDASVKVKQDKRRAQLNVESLIEDEKIQYQRAGYEYKELYDQDPRLAALQSSKDLLEFIKSRSPEEISAERGETVEKAKKSQEDSILYNQRAIADLEADLQANPVVSSRKQQEATPAIETPKVPEVIAPEQPVQETTPTEQKPKEKKPKKKKEPAKKTSGKKGVGPVPGNVEEVVAEEEAKENASLVDRIVGTKDGMIKGAVLSQGDGMLVVQTYDGDILELAEEDVVPLTFGDELEEEFVDEMDPEVEELATDAVAQVEPVVESAVIDDQSSAVMLQKYKKDKDKSAVIKAAKGAVAAIRSVLPNVQIIVHESQSSYENAVKESGGLPNSAGNFIYDYREDGRYNKKMSAVIHINLEKANERTVVHEVTHAILLSAFGNNTKQFSSFRKAVSKLITQEANDELTKFANKYTGVDDNAKAEEYLAELSGMIYETNAKIKIDNKILKGIANLINDLVATITGDAYKPFKNVGKETQLLEFMSSLSEKIRAEEDAADVVAGVAKLASKKKKSTGKSTKVNKAQILGESGVSNLDLEDGLGRLESLVTAKGMDEIVDSKGKKRFDAKSILKLTGWQKDSDGKWKYEISDRGAFIVSRSELISDLRSNTPALLGDVYDHPELYKAYPELKNMPVLREREVGTAGSFSWPTKTMFLNPDTDPKTLELTIAHEAQHYIQFKENFGTVISDPHIEILAAKAGMVPIDGDTEENETRRNRKIESIADDLKRFTGKDGIQFSDIMAGEYDKKTYGKALQQTAQAINKYIGVDDDEFNEMSSAEVKDLVETVFWHNMKARAFFYTYAWSEAESRNVEKRYKLTPDQRLNKLLAETSDVKDKDKVYFETFSKKISKAQLTTEDGDPITPEQQKELERDNRIINWVKGKMNSYDDLKISTALQTAFGLSPSEAAKKIQDARASEVIEEIKARNNTPGRIQPAPLPNAWKKGRKVSDIIMEIGQAIGQRVQTGVKGIRSLGSYNPAYAAVTIKYEGDLDTTAHELGHGIDDKYNVRTAIDKDPAAVAEMMSMGVFGSKPPKGHPDPNFYVKGEGFAEFTRALMVNPDEAKRVAPKTFAIYEATVPSKVRDAMQNFSNDIRAFVGAPALEQVAANVQITPKQLSWRERMIERLSLGSKSYGNFRLTAWDKFMSNFVTKKQYFDKAFEYLKGLQGDPTILPSNDPRILVRLMNGYDAKFNSIVRDGMIDKEGNRLVSASGDAMNIDWLMAPFAQNGKDGKLTQEQFDQRFQETIAMMAAERTVEYGQRFKREDVLSGIGLGMFTDLSVAEKAIEEAKKLKHYPQMQEVASRYRELADATMKYMLSKGRMKLAVYDKDENGNDALVGGYLFIVKNNVHYLAMRRIMTTPYGENIDDVYQKGSRLTRPVQVVREAKGSTKMIANPFVSLFDNIHRAVKEADRNEVLLEFRAMMLNDRSSNQATTTRKQVSDIGQRVGAPGKGTVTIFVNGEPEYWIFAPEVKESMDSIGRVKELGTIQKALAYPGRVLRASVTNFPVFAARNFVRDFQHRIILSGNGPRETYKIYKGMSFNKDKWSKAAVYGALNSGVYLHGQGQYYGLLNAAIKDVVKRNGYVMTRDAFSNFANNYHEFLYKFESVGRVAEYNNEFDFAKKKGYSDYDAAIYAASKSRGLIDFSEAGYIMEQINTIVPFSNAAVQGLASTVKMFGTNPVGASLRMLTLAILPQIAFALMNHMDDDTSEEYESLPVYQRDMFYNFKVGDTWVSIPKPFEVGLLGSFFDRGYSAYYGYKNPKRIEDVEISPNAFKGFEKSVFRAVMPLATEDALGPMKILGEILTNYDFFRDAHIIPPGDENSIVRLRKGTETASAISRMFSKVMANAGSLIGDKTEDMLTADPRKVDFFIRNQFSYFGDFIIKGSNLTERLTTGETTGRDKFTLSSTGFFKDYNAYTSKPVQEYLNMVKELKLLNSPMHRNFAELSKLYFASKDEDEKKRMGKQLVENAMLALQLSKNEDWRQQLIDKKEEQ